MRHTDGVGDRLPEQHRHDRRDQDDDPKRPGPTLERRDQILTGAEVSEHAFPSGGDLNGLAHDGENHEIADERGESAVAVTEQSREQNRRDQCQTVVNDHRPGETNGLACIGALQAFKKRRNSVSHARRTVAEAGTGKGNTCK